MKALSIWQPWAQLLAVGVKHDETRSWGTSYRGPILIHAAKRKMNYSTEFIGLHRSPFYKYFKVMGYGAYENILALPHGAIIGMAELVDCRKIDQEYHDFVRDFCRSDYAFGDFTVGRYAWRMEKPVLFKEPIPAAGKQGLWNWDGDLPELPLWQPWEGE